MLQRLSLVTALAALIAASAYLIHEQLAYFAYVGQLAARGF